MSQDNANGKVTNIELQMMVDEMIRTLPYHIEALQVNAKVLKARFESLKKKGFQKKKHWKLLNLEGENFNCKL